MIFKDGFKIDDRLAVIFLFLFSLCMFLIFMSNHLDDWDSIQFALAIHDFDITKHQPHPPGYAAYIIMAKLSYLLVKNDILALTLLSSIFGSITIVFTYLLARQLFNSQTALLASILLFINPALFIFSIVAMNDVVAVCFIVIASFFLLKGYENKILFLVGALIAGFGVGVRPQNIPIFMFVFVYSFFRINGIKLKIYSLLFSFSGAIIWLIPVIWTHGFFKYIDMGYRQFSWGKPSRMSFDFMGILRNYELLTQGWHLLFLVLLIISIIMLCKVIAGYGLKDTMERLKKKEIIYTGNAYLLSWFLIATITQLFFYHLYISRYIITSLIPLVIMFSCAICHLFKSLNSEQAKRVIAVMLALCIIYTGAKTIHQAYCLKSIEPSPVQATVYINERFNKDEVAIITVSHPLRHFQYYLKGYRLFYGGAEELNKNLIKISKIKDIKWVVSTLDLGINNGNKLIFFRDKDIYPKHEKTSLYIYSLSTNNIFCFWEKGFSDLEVQKDGSNKRWCSKKGVLVLHNMTKNSLPIELSMELAAGYKEYSELIIKSKYFEEKLQINNKPQFYKKSITLLPGYNEIEFKSNAKKVYAPKDPRFLYFKVLNFSMMI